MVSTSCVTKDGNVLIGGISRDTSLGYTWYGHLLKVNSNGDTIWSKQFNDSIYSTVDIQFVKELSDGSIFISGDYLIQPTSADSFPFPALMICKLTSTGDIIWAKTYKSVLNTCNYVPVRLTSIAEGLNNEILLGGNLSNCPNPIYQFIGKVNSQGNLLWDKNIKQWNNFEYVEGIFYVGGKVVVLGRSGGVQSGGDDVIDVHFTELDYNSGALLNTKAWQPDVSSSRPYAAFYKSFVLYGVFSELLNNGNYLIYGKLFDSFDDYTVRDSVDHFAVLEFNKSFDYIKGYTIHSPLLSRYYLNQVSADKNGSVSHSLYSPEGSSDSYQFFGVIENGEIVKQRKIFYPGNLYAGIKQLQLLPDGSNVFIETILTNNGYSTPLEFTKMHNSDTTNSDCTGIDTAFAELSPIQYVPYAGFNIDSISINRLYETTNKVYASVFNYVADDICKQMPLCDTIKIRGTDSVCSADQLLTYTAYRSKTCGAKARWTIDTSAVAVFNQVNDTTLNIKFKNNFNGYLHAEFTSRCGPVTDSLKILVLQTPAPLELGPDTIICSANSLLLKAPDDYVSYRWQDNSLLPAFNAVSSGKYYVTIVDACGRMYSDTITVSFKPVLDFYVANDTSKCNNDTILLTAPAGFMDYTWTPGYNITADTGRVVKVFPAINTAYIVRAKNATGCYVTDTIHINAMQSSAIFLGNDTSLCSGQNLALNAGHVFKNYEWNTTETTAQILVNTAGTYSLSATAFTGCISKDTITINVYALPQFTLGNDTALCEKQHLDYNFNLTGASYLWNDGVTSSARIISNGGDYWLRVTQQGCGTSDTISVNYKPLPVVNLGNDTTLCKGDIKLLNAQNAGSTYKWQDLSINQTYTVTTSGKYYVNVTANNCTAGDTVNINYKLKPSFYFTENPVICSGQQLTLSPVVNSVNTYLWQDGSTGSSLIVTKGGTYSLVVSNGCGSYNNSITITEGSCELYIPNAFTPNHDGINDLFRIKYPWLIKTFRMVLFNRFGEKLFETSDASAGWDGKFKSDDQPEGAYPWIITFANKDGIVQSLKGTVILVR